VGGGIEGRRRECEAAGSVIENAKNRSSRGARCDAKEWEACFYERKQIKLVAGLGSLGNRRRHEGRVLITCPANKKGRGYLGGGFKGT